MLTTTALLVAGTLTAQFQYGNPLPTSEDHLRSPPGEKRVSLIMDVSCSMGWGAALHPDCVYAHSMFGTYNLNKNQQMIAAAVGCRNADDGFLDLWEGRIDFAITGFGFGSSPDVRLVQDFTRDKAALETAVRGLPASGNTPLEAGLLLGSYRHNLFWNDSLPNTNVCDQHYNILLTDGVPNGSRPAMFNWLPCGGPSYAWPPSGIPPIAAWVYDDPVDPNDQFGDDELDVVCNQSGNQDISTFTVGFGPPGDLDVNLLTNIAVAGGGFFVHATNAYQLAEQFNLILASIVTRTGRFTTPSIQTNGLLLGNQSYAASFVAVETGPWLGNLKSYCIYPEKNPATGKYYLEDVPQGQDCIFRFRDPDGAGPLEPIVVSSDHPRDFFSGTTSIDARNGGAAAVFFRSGAPRSGQFGGGAPEGVVPYSSQHFLRRRILSWSSPSSGYVDIANLAEADIFAWNCARTKLLSYLHGYDPGTVNCAAGVPTRFNEHPLGAAVTTTPTIIRWGSDCTQRDQCLVAANLDDGGVHFFDAADGLEHSVVIPKQLFKPGLVGNYPLSTILDQPTPELTRKPYNNGAMVRVHDDRNANGIIDNGESAYLVWGLGNGGAAYYAMDISQKFSSSSGPGGTTLVPDSDNPLYTILATDQSWTENLRNTMSKPWVGRTRFGSAPEITLGVTSGSVWYQTRPDEDFGNRAVGMRPPFDATSARNLTCVEFATFNGYDAALADTQLCAAAGTPLYQMAFGGAEGDFRSARPLWYVAGTGAHRSAAGAIGNFTFSQFDLDTGDYLVFEDLGGNEISPRYTGNLGAVTLPIWIAQRPFMVRLHIDNTQTRAAAGVVWTGVQWIPDRLLGGCGGGNPCEPCDRNGNSEDGQCTPAPQECDPGSSLFTLNQCHYCDMDQNGTCAGAECGIPSTGYMTTGTGGVSSCMADPHNPFVALLALDRIDDDGAFQDTTDTGAVRALFTKDCRGISYPNGSCYSETTLPDLAYMTCPISAEIRAYEEGGIAKAFYVGDECGQMWKFWTDNGGVAWNAKRLFTTSVPGVSGAESRDFRKFTRPVDLVITQCTGAQAVGVYFGTGDMYRPGTTDGLEGTTGAQVSAYTEQTGRGQVTSRNVVGAFFDKGQWDTGASRTLTAFENLTPTNFTTATAPVFSKTGDGWFFALRDNEQMLRDPLVFDGVFYAKTNTVLSATTPCVAGTTVDRVYSINNCTAQATQDPNGNGTMQASEREVAIGQQDIGSNLLLYTPPDGSAPLVSTAGMVDGQAANLASNTNRRALRMYMWWRVQ